MKRRSLSLLVLLVLLLTAVGEAKPSDPLRLSRVEVKDPVVRELLRTVIADLQHEGSRQNLDLFPYELVWIGQTAYTVSRDDGVVRKTTSWPRPGRGTGVKDGWAYAVCYARGPHLERASDGERQVVLRQTGGTWKVVAVFEGSTFDGTRSELVRRGVPAYIIKDLDMDVR